MFSTTLSAWVCVAPRVEPLPAHAQHQARTPADRVLALMPIAQRGHAGLEADADRRFGQVAVPPAGVVAGDLAELAVLVVAVHAGLDSVPECGAGIQLGAGANGDPFVGNQAPDVPGHAGVADRDAESLRDPGVAREAVRTMSAVSRRAIEWGFVMPPIWGAGVPWA